ncbi:hypothetical protein COY28_05300, partial [Candidatus Woesearchaeota archaeon CG_4_10_14_0_2_um_filter_57_5]
MQQNYDELVAKVLESGKINQKELDQKVKEKIEKLSGLISKEGAVHIVANELGIRLAPAALASTQLKIANIQQGLRNVETAGRVTRVFEKREFSREGRSGKLASFVIADESGSIRVVMWGDLAETIANIKEGDIVKVSGAYTKTNNLGAKELHCNERSKIDINPEGIDIAVTGPQRKWVADLAEGDQVELVGSIVQAFDPRFFEICPQCNRRARPGTEGFACDTHGVVSPAYGCVLNAMFDDGTGSIRLVLFRQQAAQLLKKDDAGLEAFREAPEDFIPLKQELIGSIIKARGRVNRNKLYDRL